VAKQVNVYEAKTQLSKLLEQVEAGDEIVIARNGRPVARLVPLQRALPDRLPGGWEGKVWMAPDFDEPDEERLQRGNSTRRVTWPPRWCAMGSRHCR
jgi:prevent-host-death family protein